MSVILVSDFDKSKYLKSEDIGDRERKFRIKDATPEKIGDDKEEKLVVWFTNDKRGLVLNQTNLRVLRAAFGDPVKGWIGKIIVIFTMLVDNRGKMTPGLRVRIPPPKQSAATAEPPQQPVKSGSGAAAPSPTSGNGAAAIPAATAAPPAAPAVHDPELEPDPVKPIKEKLDDEIAF
jgi:hypothetical protein